MVFGIVTYYFFKQDLAYDMRISGWSSDVCSSVLAARRAPPARGPAARSRRRERCGDPLRRLGRATTAVENPCGLSACGQSFPWPRGLAVDHPALACADTMMRNGLIAGTHFGSR